MKFLSMSVIKIFLVAACFIMTAAVAYAYDFEVNGIYYNITSMENQTVEVTFGDNKYTGDIIIPSSVEFSNRAFTVSAFDDYAFGDCTEMTNLLIPNTVNRAGSDVFRGCSSLVSLSIPATMTFFGQGAFSYCSALTNLIIEDGETALSISYNSNVGNYASSFYDCPLKSVYIGRNIGGGCGDYFAKFHCQTSLTELIIGKAVIEIGDFVGCSKLEHINIPGNVKIILPYAFKDCVKLTDVILNEGLTGIEYNAFDGCTSIQTLLIPSSVQQIGSEAFQNCREITKVYSKATTPARIYESTFPGIVYFNAVLYVPTGTKSLYEASTGWKNFGSIVETDDFDDLSAYYSFNVSTTAGGKVSVLDNTLSNTSLSASVKEGNKVILSFTLNKGYELKSLKVNGTEVVNEVKDNSYTISAVKENTTIVVTFSELPIYLTIKSAENGSIAQEIEKGKAYSFIITPSEGWSIESVSFNGSDVTLQMDGNKYTTPVITSHSELNIVHTKEIQTAVKSIRSESNIKVSASFGKISVNNGGSTTTLSVFSTSGSKVAEEAIVTGITTIDLPINNIYIIKVGEETFKVSM